MEMTNGLNLAHDLASEVSHVRRMGCVLSDRLDGLLMESTIGMDLPATSAEIDALRTALTAVPGLPESTRPADEYEQLSQQQVNALLAVIDLQRGEPATLKISPIRLPDMPDNEIATWNTLLDISQRIPYDWCLAGGQMVHLHCWQRDVTPPKPTQDADVLMDVRARPGVHRSVTGLLKNAGFALEGSNALTGHGHRWSKDTVKIDVLYPEGIGRRASARSGAAGSTTLEVPGGTQALSRTQLVPIVVGERVGHIPRPDLLGALVGKCAALTIVLDPLRERHFRDITTLAAMVTSPVALRARLTDRDRRWISHGLGELPIEHWAWNGIPNATQIHAQLTRASSSA